MMLGWSSCNVSCQVQEALGMLDGFVVSDLSVRQSFLLTWVLLLLRVCAAKLCSVWNCSSVGLVPVLIYVW